MDERRKEGVERARKGGSGGSRQGERERERERRSSMTEERDGILQVNNGKQTFRSINRQ